MARVGLNLSGRAFAKLAGVGYATLARFEAGATIADETRDKIEKTLAEAGAQFTRRSGRVGVTVPEGDATGAVDVQAAGIDLPPRG